jgi:hypothetical protein
MYGDRRGEDDTAWRKNVDNDFRTINLDCWTSIIMVVMNYNLTHSWRKHNASCRGGLDRFRGCQSDKCNRRLREDDLPPASRNLPPALKSPRYPSRTRLPFVLPGSSQPWTTICGMDSSKRSINRTASKRISGNMWVCAEVAKRRIMAEWGVNSSFKYIRMQA